MGELKEKIKGNANEAAGEIKQQSNDPETRSEGREQEAKGKAQPLLHGSRFSHAAATDRGRKNP